VPPLTPAYRQAGYPSPTRGEGKEVEYARERGGGREEVDRPILI